MDIKMINIEEILNIIDKKYGYAQDPDVIRLLKESKVSQKYMHLVDRRSFNRFLTYYANEHGYSDYYDLIHVDGGTKGTKYDYDDIMKFIDDPKVEERIKGLLMKKTISAGPFGLIPMVIYHEYIEEITGEEENRIMELTGYTRHQLKLFSVPDDILEQVKFDKENRIKSLRAELESCLIDLEDITNELRTRGM